MTQIKICGLKTRQAVELVHELGIDYIGFVFAPSTRRITPEAAAELMGGLADKATSIPQRIGVFVNESLSKMLQIGEAAGLDGYQLHGDESPAFCENLKARTGKLVWKAWKVTNSQTDRRAADFRGAVDAILLDAFTSAQAGGTGLTFPWEAMDDLQEILPNVPLITAGGLTPDNLDGLLGRYSPYAVDVSSGVETNGVKDLDKIRLFVEKVRENA